MTRFSIIVVCLNAGHKLKETVESILSQTYEDYEIVIKDGMSTDGSLDQVPQDSRIRVCCRQDKGIYDGMNQAVEEARGEYVYFLNCGDRFYDRDVLRRTAGEIAKQEKRTLLEEKGNAVGSFIFYGDIYERVTGQRVASNPNMNAFACYRNVPCHQACFYQSGLLRRKPFDISYWVRADYEHFLWCFFEGGAATEYMPFLIADYEGGGFSETKENLKRSRWEHKQITGKYMAKGQLLWYRMIMLATLAPLRTWLAGNRATARVYHTMKRMMYRNGG